MKKAKNLPNLLQRELAAIVASSDDAIIGKTLDGTITSWNQGAERMYGYTADEIIGQPVDVLAPPDQPDEIPEILRRLRRGEHIDHYETERVAKDGRRLNVSLRISPIRDEEGEIAGASAIARDITRLKEIERERERLLREEHKARTAAQDAQRRLVEALGRVTDLYRVSREIGTINTMHGALDALLSSRVLSEASHAWVALFDVPWQEEAPTTLEVVAVWRPDAAEVDITGRRYELAHYGMADILSRDKPVIMTSTGPGLQAPAQSYANGLMLEAHSAAFFPLIAGGLWYGIFVVLFTEPHEIVEADVHHVQGLVAQAASAIYNIGLLKSEAEARLEAERANALKMQFLAMISHELRTPLTSIQGFSSTLLADDVVWSETEQREFIRIIGQEAEQLTDLVDQLLDLSRLEAGMLRIEREMGSLSKLLAEMEASLAVVAAGHELVIDVTGELPDLYMDGRRVGQVISNLVNNASRYAPEGTRICITARPENGVVRVDVTDQGPGIPPEERQAVFEAFRQASNRPGHEDRGAGLGLAIARGLVAQHGGRIWIADTGPQGTTVSFTLPAQAAG